MSLTQFGLAPNPSDLASSAPNVTVEPAEPLPWEQAIEVASRFDAAIVIGNRPPHRTQVPSKVIEYLTLPIPRVALSSGVEGDELAAVATALPGYLSVTTTDADLPEQVDAFLRRDWSLDALAPPDRYSWGRVAADVTDFFLEKTMPVRPGEDQAAGTQAAG